MFVRPLNVGGVHGRGGCGGRVDRRCSGVSKVRRHRHGTVIGRGQATNKRGGRRNISERGNHLPLADSPRDLGGGGSSAIVRGGTGGTGSRSVPPWAVFPVAPVTRALLLLTSVSTTSSSVSPRCGTAVIRSRAAAGPTVPFNARAPAVPVASATVGAGAGPRSITHARVPVDPVVRGAGGGGVGQPSALSHVRGLVSLVAVALLAPEVGEIGAGIRPADGVW